MHRMTTDEQITINETLALALGWTLIRSVKDCTEYSLWDGPLGINHYEPFPPQFCRGWKCLKMLVKAMRIAGYDKFTMHGDGDNWTAGFSCEVPHCRRHYNSDHHKQKHGSTSVPGQSPGDAAACAAIMALRSAGRIVLARDIPHDDEIIKVDLRPAINVIQKYMTYEQYTACLL